MAPALPPPLLAPTWWLRNGKLQMVDEGEVGTGNRFANNLCIALPAAPIYTRTLTAALKAAASMERNMV